MEETKRRAVLQVLPNVVTCLGMSCGLVSLFFSLHGDVANAAWLVLLCVLLDKLDGTLARRFNAGSELGVQLDSLSDFLAFVVAPAVLVTAAATTSPAPFSAMPAALAAYASAAVYVCAGAARLARYNCREHAGAGLRDFFEGVPTTLCGALAASLLLTVERHCGGVRCAVVFPPLLVFMGLAMVSKIYIPKLGRRTSRPVHWFTVGNGVAVPVLVVLRLAPEYLLFLALLYIVVGGLWANRKSVEIS